jgi:pyruvate formate lyase activating enzyme
MNIASIRPFTLSDYPGKLAAIVFTRGCNFRCPYCHNRSLIPLVGESAADRKLIPVEGVLDFLKHRRGKQDGLVITGGEPTLQEGLLAFMERVKRLGYFLKLDTNGSLPGALKEVIREALADYIAMDIKGPLEKYREVVNRPVDTEDIMESIRLIKDSGIDHEFRTTVVKSLLTPADLMDCGRMIRGAARYILQKPVPLEVPGGLHPIEPGYSDSELHQIVERLTTLAGRCYLR